MQTSSKMYMYSVFPLLTLLSFIVDVVGCIRVGPKQNRLRTFIVFIVVIIAEKKIINSY